MVDNVDPRQDVDEQLRIPGVTSSDTLQVLGHARLAVQGLTLLDLANHLAHIHLDFPVVLGEPIKPSCGHVSDLIGTMRRRNILQERW